MGSVVVPDIEIPQSLRPADGRFGCGPSKVRPQAVAALAATHAAYLGTSHRQPPVRDMVARLRSGLLELFAAPPGYEVLLGNGGASLFWDAATFGLIERRSQHCVFGEFSLKFAQAAAAAPHLGAPERVDAEPGSHPLPHPRSDIDTYALTHNETSTGVVMPIRRPAQEGLVLVDATSAAGAVPVDLAETDVYYFSLQKVFAADGGLWVAVCSPAAIRRIEAIAASRRWVPSSLSLPLALANSRLEQTVNTPSLATLFLAVHQLDWMHAQGGLAGAVARSAAASTVVYRWAESRPFARPFVSDPVMRSPVVATIDLDPEISAGTVSQVLRRNGIVDTDAYRKLGRNQLRIGLFPAVELDDCHRLVASIDHVVAALVAG
ncbi:MAG TPA: phosphoserine transaminase [Verrucomicrobiae bacterium]|nr:phosphoserine transaminase [Verrucomicrobiae bacterium]